MGRCRPIHFCVYIAGASSRVSAMYCSVLNSVGSGEVCWPAAHWHEEGYLYKLRGRCARRASAMLGGALLAVWACAGYDQFDDKPFFIKITTWPPSREVFDNVLGPASGYSNSTPRELLDSGPADCQPDYVSQADYYPSEEAIAALSSDNSTSPVVQQLLTDIDEVENVDGSIVYTGYAQMSHASPNFNGQWADFDARDHTEFGLDYIFQQLSVEPTVQQYVQHLRQGCIAQQTESQVDAEDKCPESVGSDNNLGLNWLLPPTNDLTLETYAMQDWLSLFLYFFIKHSDPASLRLFCEEADPELVSPELTVWRNAEWGPGRCLSVDCSNSSLTMLWRGRNVLDVFDDAVQPTGLKIPLWTLLPHGYEGYDKVFDQAVDNLYNDGQSNDGLVCYKCLRAFQIFPQEVLGQNVQISVRMHCLPEDEAINSAGQTDTPDGDCSPGDICTKDYCQLYREHTLNGCDNLFVCFGTLLDETDKNDYYAKCQRSGRCCASGRSKKYFAKPGDDGYDWRNETVAVPLESAIISVFKKWSGRTYLGNFSWSERNNTFHMTFSQSTDYGSSNVMSLIPSTCRTRQCDSVENLTESVGSVIVRPDGETCVARKVTLPGTSVQRWQTIQFKSDSTALLADRFVCAFRALQLPAPPTARRALSYAAGLTTPVSPLPNRDMGKTDISVSYVPPLQQSPADSETHWWVVGLVVSAAVVAGGAYYAKRRRVSARPGESRALRYRKMSQA